MLQCGRPQTWSEIERLDMVMHTAVDEFYSNVIEASDHTLVDLQSPYIECNVHHNSTTTLLAENPFWSSSGPF
jgi:hypothetical protein